MRSIIERYPDGYLEVGDYPQIDLIYIIDWYNNKIFGDSIIKKIGDSRLSTN